MMLPPAPRPLRRQHSLVPSTITVLVDEERERPSAPRIRITPPVAAAPMPAPKNDRSINTDKTISCPASCICKVRARSREKRHAPPIQVISHTFRGGECYLLCLLDSPRSCPTFLRQCLVKQELRLTYSSSLAKAGGQSNSRLQDFWNVDTESAVRNALFHDLSPKEQQHQREIAVCTTTEEWCDRTNNGQVALPLTNQTSTPTDSGGTLSTDNAKTPPMQTLLPAQTPKRTKRATAPITSDNMAANKNMPNNDSPLPSTNTTTETAGSVGKVQRSPVASSPPLKKRTSPRQCKGGKSAITTQEAVVCLAPVCPPIPTSLPVDNPPVPDAEDEEPLPDTEEQEPADDNADQLFLVERILGARLGVGARKRGPGARRMEYLIKWAGFDLRQCSWEPAAQLLCTPVIKGFHTDYGRPSYKKPKILSAEGEEYERTQPEDGAPVIESGRTTRARPLRAAAAATSKRRPLR